MSSASDIHRIIIDHSDLDVWYSAIDDKITYEGIDITEPLKVVRDFWVDRMAIACGLKPIKEKRRKYKFVRDKKPKVYLSGKISGLSEVEYKTKFNSAELFLTGLGYDVINPVSYDKIKDGSWEDYMKQDLKLMLDCDYIYLLDNWEDSKGARMEYNLACDLKIPRLSIDFSGKVV